MKTLNGKGPFTVFAPTNAAFAKLKKTAPDTYAAVTTDKALLTKVLTYHVLAKKVPSTAAVAAAKKKASVKTVQGEKIKLSLKGGKLYLNGNSQVIVADVAASNGVIHAINTVLVPPSLRNHEEERTDMLKRLTLSRPSPPRLRSRSCRAATREQLVETRSPALAASRPASRFLIQNDLLRAAALQQIDYDTIDSDSGGSEGLINTDLPPGSFLSLGTVIRLHFTNPELFDWCA